jgi:hypothetical protein
VSWAAVRGDYFQAMGTPLLRGRYFGPEDGPRSSLVAIIDESMAKRYLRKGTGPVKIRLASASRARTRVDRMMTG